MPLRRFLNSHTVTTVYEKGWSSARNGDLLVLADQETFEVFLTTDQNLKHQQNLTGHQIAIVVLPHREPNSVPMKLRRSFRDARWRMRPGLLQ